MSAIHRERGQGHESIFGRVARLLGVLVLGTLVLLAATPAFGQQARKRFADTIHIVQDKPVLQKGRMELVPRLGLSINDPVRRAFRLGVGGNYHLSERLYAGALVEWSDFGGILGGPTDAFEEGRTQTRTTADAPVFNWGAGLEAGYVPIAGKFALFNSWLLYYDLGASLGGMWVNSESLALPVASSGFGATASLVNRIFFNRWMALHLEVRDVVYFARLKGVAGTSMSHAVTASAGLGVYFPFEDESAIAPASANPLD